MPALSQLDETAVVRVTGDLMTSRELLRTAKCILLAWKDVHSQTQDKDASGWRNQLGLTLIGLGGFGETVQLLESGTQGDCELEIADVVNDAMARWGLTKEVRPASAKNFAGGHNGGGETAIHVAEEASQAKYSIQTLNTRTARDVAFGPSNFEGLFMHRAANW